MLKSLLLPLLRLLPLEQIVAWLLSRLLAKATSDPKAVEKALVISDKVVESALLANEALGRLSGRQVGRHSVVQPMTRDETLKVVTQALNAWAKKQKTPGAIKAVMVYGAKP